MLGFSWGIQSVRCPVLQLEISCKCQSELRAESSALYAWAYDEAGPFPLETNGASKSCLTAPFYTIASIVGSIEAL